MTIAAVKAFLARPAARRTLTALFLTAVALLITRQATLVDWTSVGQGIRRYDSRTIAIGLFLAGVSYLIYSSFDIIGRQYVGHRLPTATVMRIAFISCAFNQSLGALIGGVAFRLRMYSRAGLDTGQVSTIILCSAITNWFGYFVLAGVIFVSHSIALPANWGGGRNVLQIAGALLLGTAGAYLALCAIRKPKVVRIRMQQLRIPSLSFALLQLVLAIAHWPMAAAIVYVLLQEKIEFVTVLGAMLLSAIATVVAHIPAGIGILEAVLLGILGKRVPISELLAALVVYRAIYQLAPLALATAVYLPSEFNQRRRNQSGSLLRR